MEQIDFKGREIESVEYGENEIVVRLKAVKFEPKFGDFVKLKYAKNRIGVVCFERFASNGNILTIFGLSPSGNFYMRDVFHHQKLLSVEPITDSE